MILGDNGLADFDPSSGTAVLVRVETNEPTHGSADFVTAGDGEKIIFGGAGGDQLLAGSDALPDLILGDEGIATFDATTGLRVTVETTTATQGGDDVITGGNAFNLLLGGSGNDHITGGSVQDVILGDNGQIDFLYEDADPATLDRVITTDPTLGGKRHHPGWRRKRYFDRWHVRR